MKTRILIAAVICLSGIACARTHVNNLEVVSAGTWAMDEGLDYFVFKNSDGGQIRLWCPLTQSNSKELLASALAAKSVATRVNISYEEDVQSWVTIDASSVPPLRAGPHGLIIKIEVN